MEDRGLPPGFRFSPTDEEIVGYYLKNKLEGKPSPGNFILEQDLYKCEPWELRATPGCGLSENEWYVFSPRAKKYPNGLRTNRATVAGYWKATGKDRVIKAKGVLSSVRGAKKTLVFYSGRAPQGERTNWVMHEYRMEPDSDAGMEDLAVLCRVSLKSTSTAKAKRCREEPDEEIFDALADLEEVGEQQRSISEFQHAAGKQRRTTEEQPSPTYCKTEAISDLTGDLQRTLTEEEEDMLDGAVGGHAPAAGARFRETYLGYPAEEEFMSEARDAMPRTESAYSGADSGPLASSFSDEDPFDDLQLTTGADGDVPLPFVDIGFPDSRGSRGGAFLASTQWDDSQPRRPAAAAAPAAAAEATETAFQALEQLGGAPNEHNEYVADGLFPRERQQGLFDELLAAHTPEFDTWLEPLSQPEPAPPPLVATGGALPPPSFQRFAAQQAAAAPARLSAIDGLSQLLEDSLPATAAGDHQFEAALRGGQHHAFDSQEAWANALQDLQASALRPGAPPPRPPIAEGGEAEDRGAVEDFPDAWRAVGFSGAPRRAGAEVAAGRAAAAGAASGAQQHGTHVFDDAARRDPIPIQIRPRWHYATARGLPPTVPRASSEQSLVERRVLMAVPMRQVSHPERASAPLEVPAGRPGERTTVEPSSARDAARPGTLATQQSTTRRLGAIPGPGAPAPGSSPPSPSASPDAAAHDGSPEVGEGHFLDFLGDSQDASFSFAVRRPASPAEREGAQELAVGPEVAQVMGEGGGSLSGWLWPPTGPGEGLQAPGGRGRAVEDQDRESFANQLPAGRSRSSTPDSTRAAARAQAIPGSQTRAAVAPGAPGGASVAHFQMRTTNDREEGTFAAAFAQRHVPPVLELQPAPAAPPSTIRGVPGDASGSSARTHLIYDPTPPDSEASEQDARGGASGMEQRPVPRSTSTSDHALTGGGALPSREGEAGSGRGPPRRVQQQRPSFAERLVGRLLAGVPALPANAAELLPGTSPGADGANSAANLHHGLRSFSSAPELLRTKAKVAGAAAPVPPLQQRRRASIPTPVMEKVSKSNAAGSTVTTASSSSRDLADTAGSTQVPTRPPLAGSAALSSRERGLYQRTRAAKPVPESLRRQDSERPATSSLSATTWLLKLGHVLSVCSLVGFVGVVCCFSWAFSTVL